MERNLAAFLAAARLGSLTEAADALNITQPSVSKRIANIEADFGIPLFERDRYGMTLTEAGHVVLEYAIRIEAEYRFSREAVQAIGGAGMSTMRVGAGPLFHLSCVANLFTELKARFPNLNLELITDIQKDTRDALIGGQLDIYLGVISKRDHDDRIRSHIVTEVEHGVVMKPNHPCAGERNVDIRDLSGQQWVIFGFDEATETRIEAYSRPTVQKRDVIGIRTTSFATGLQLVKDGPFIMSAPLQLSNRVHNEGLVIKRTMQGMPKRGAGMHFRKSSANFGAIQSSLKFFEGFQF